MGEDALQACSIWYEEFDACGWYPERDTKGACLLEGCLLLEEQRRTFLRLRGHSVIRTPRSRIYGVAEVDGGDELVACHRGPSS